MKKAFIDLNETTSLSLSLSNLEKLGMYKLEDKVSSLVTCDTLFLYSSGLKMLKYVTLDSEKISLDPEQTSFDGKIFESWCWTIQALVLNNIALMLNYTSLDGELYKLCCWSIQGLLLKYTSLGAELYKLKCWTKRNKDAKILSPTFKIKILP